MLYALWEPILRTRWVIWLAALALVGADTGAAFWFGAREAFPVLVVLGPLIILHYRYWRRRQGQERAMWQYLQAEPTLGNQ